MYHSARNPVPSRVVLEEREASTRQELVRLIVYVSCGRNRSDTTAIQDTAIQLKSVCNHFENASRALGWWLFEHGYMDQALTVRRERPTLAFLECKDALLDLNILLCDHNLDALSINEAQSVFSEAAAMPPS